MVYFQSTHTSVGRSRWIRSSSDQNCSRRATVRLGTDTLIANVLVYLVQVIHIARRLNSVWCPAVEIGTGILEISDTTTPQPFYGLFPGPPG